ncbi:MAG: 3-dehydroquinate synthase [Planctomycetota bacterium]|nr:3-dehydroquinate synthase [Planctomycetota bacterium]
MATVELNLPHHRYQILIEPGLLARMGEQVRRVAPHRLAALMFDASVREPHARVAQASLAAAGFQVTPRAVDSAEERKTLETVRDLYAVLVEGRLERTSPVVALGGGVMGDSIGFLASTYLRGVPFIQSPTTLLAMVDASVGGKVGVNLPQGKNLVGSFYQPHLVLIDTDTLMTLPARELRCGLAECVKHGVIRDPDLFAWIEDRLDAITALDSATLVELVRRNVQIKANVVMADEKETGERAHLNFGHTFAHAIEAISGYGVYHHGEAVALGMVAAARLAAKAGRCPAELPVRITRLLDRIGLPTSAPNLPPTHSLMEAMKLDKKVAAGKIRLVLPERMGAVSIVGDTPEAAVVAAWETLRRPA